MRILRLAWSGYQTESSLREEQTKLEQAGFDYRRVDEMGQPPDDLHQYHAVIVNSQYSIDESFLDAWNRDGTVIVASSGYDNVDLDACEQNGVTAVRCPEARADRVVKHTLTLIRALVRDVSRSNQALRKERWTRSESFRRITRLSSLTVGILGFGVIGRRMASALGERDCYEILAHDPHKRGTIEQHQHVRYRSFGELCGESNLLTVHACLTDETRELIGRNELRQLREPAYLVNTARGEIVDVDALLDVLEEERLTGAALDVFPEEPFEHGGNSLPDTLITTPHTAGFGPGLLSDLREEITEIMNDLREGRSPSHEITGT